MTDILKIICVSNKQVFLEAVWKIKKFKVGSYIASERMFFFFFFFFCSSWFVLYIYSKYIY